MGIEHVDVGVHPAHVRAGCRVELETDADNDLGCDIVTAHIDDVTFAVLHLDGDNSARAQLVALLEVFTKATVAVAEKLSGLGARLAAAEADE